MCRCDANARMFARHMFLCPQVNALKELCCACVCVCVWLFSLSSLSASRRCLICNRWIHSSTQTLRNAKYSAPPASINPQRKCRCCRCCCRMCGKAFACKVNFHLHSFESRLTFTRRLRWLQSESLALSSDLCCGRGKICSQKNLFCLY